MPPPTLPRLPIFLTGGTIASRRDPESGAVRAVAGGAELLAQAPELAAIARPEVVPVARVNGWNVDPALMWTLARRVEAALADPDVPGAVVTHGTDTVEETAYLLDLVLRSDKPVAFAVALRAMDEPSADGPRNLLDAARVALDPASRGRGALVVANEEAHAARAVVKTHATNPAAFASPVGGPAASLAGGRVRYHHPSRPRRPIAAERIEPEVLLVKVAAGADDRPLRWAVEAGFRGLVVEGSGAGNVPAAVLPGVAAAVRAGLPVVLTTRCPDGALAPIYGGGAAAGGGRDLLALGAIPAPGLPAQKARIKLMVALGATQDPEEVRRLFAEES